MREREKESFVRKALRACYHGLHRDACKCLHLHTYSCNVVFFLDGQLRWSIIPLLHHSYSASKPAKLATSCDISCSIKELIAYPLQLGKRELQQGQISK